MAVITPVPVLTDWQKVKLEAEKAIVRVTIELDQHNALLALAEAKISGLTL